MKKTLTAIVLALTAGCADKPQTIGGGPDMGYVPADATHVANEPNAEYSKFLEEVAKVANKRLPNYLTPQELNFFVLADFEVLRYNDTSRGLKLNRPTSQDVRQYLESSDCEGFLLNGAPFQVFDYGLYAILEKEKVDQYINLKKNESTNDLVFYRKLGNSNN